MQRVLVVGAGASGMTAAIAAAKKGASVTILERMERPGKKLLITGNGRCNLTNRKGRKNAYRGADEAWTARVLETFSVRDTLDFFGKMGLLTRERDGYVYPYTDQASTVVDLLLQELRAYRVKLKCKEEVTEIQKTEEGFLVCTRTWKYACDRVILCTGGRAAPQTGSDGSGYVLAGKCGHSLRPVYPALVPLKAKGRLPAILSGTRNQAKLALEIDGGVICEETGELQWTDYGVSGIVVFQVSRFAATALGEKKTVILHIDMLPEYTAGELFAYFQQKEAHMPGQSREGMLVGLVKKKVISAYFAEVGKKKHFESEEEFYNSVIAWMKDVTLEITGTKSFDMAQACAGGVPAEEVFVKTLESKKLPGLYIAGELLDVDAICGGYNLQWAWSSGYVAGTYAADPASPDGGA